MARVLAVADEVSEGLYGSRLTDLAPDVIVSCGDLPFDFLEYLVTVAGVPLLYVLGNHDPDPGGKVDPSTLLSPAYLTRSHKDPPGPPGCTSIEGRWLDVAGIRIAGLGGSTRYSPGPNQYTERQMNRRVRRLVRRFRWEMLRGGLSSGGPGIDLFVTHSPPRDAGDRDDPAHRGFSSFHRIITIIAPTVFVHGHVHPHGPRPPDLRIGSTEILNAVGCRLIEVGP